MLSEKKHDILILALKLIQNLQFQVMEHRKKNVHSHHY